MCNRRLTRGVWIPQSDTRWQEKTNAVIEGMGMSHVFSIIYTALLFLSQPLSQLSILLDRNQSAICQSLSILLLIYVSSCSWLQAAGDWEKGKWKRSTFVQRHLIRAVQSSCFIPFGRKVTQNQMRKTRRSLCSYCRTRVSISEMHQSILHHAL